jgi:hypothetical protein
VSKFVVRVADGDDGADVGPQEAVCVRAHSCIGANDLAIGWPLVDDEDVFGFDGVPGAAFTGSYIVLLNG